MLVLVSSGASANDLVACFNQCKLIQEEAKNLKCEVAAAGENSSVLFLDILRKPLSTREKIYFNQMLSCYFKTGGSIGEIHFADSKEYFSFCSPAPKLKAGYTCERSEMKYSQRKVGAKK